VASHRAVGSAVDGKIETPHSPAAVTASWNRASRSTLTSTNRGSSDTDANALAVIA
jgi:hypothetical protein